MRSLLDNQNPQQNSNKLFWGLFGSGILHLLLFVTQTHYRADVIPQPENQAPIEITQVPDEYLRTPPTEQQKKKTVRKDPEIAETEDANNRKLDPNATILSDRNQTAEKQTRAKAIDDFRKKQGTGMKADAKEGMSGVAPTGSADGEENKSPLDEDIGAGENKNKGIKRNWKTLSLKDLSVGGDGAPTAASDDNLSGVEEGDATVLSTREFRYFSYYHRIKELLRQHWKPEVERKIALIWAKGKQIDKEELTTKLLILLDEKGTIQKISRLGTSGHAEVDSAAVQAFEKAAPFPNPPKGIVDADGFIRIRWDFILKAQTGPQIRMQRAPGRPMP